MSLVNFALKDLHQLCKCTSNSVNIWQAARGEKIGLKKIFSVIFQTKFFISFPPSLFCIDQNTQQFLSQKMHCFRWSPK